MQESQIAIRDNAHEATDDATLPFIAPDKIAIAHFAPSTALAPFVTQIYFFQCEERQIRDRQPAALGHLIFLLRGTGFLKFQDGHIDALHPASVFGPGGGAAEFTLNGPLYDLGFALSPLGFVALTGKPANDYVDRALAASELFGPDIDELADHVIAGYATGALRLSHIVEKISAFLLARLRPVPPAHLALIQAVNEWLSSGLDPDLEALYLKLGVSRSTAARLTSRYFGSPPKPLMRKYRALRAASLLCDPACTDELRTKIASSFYDQPHMIREIRQFAGRTPGALDGDDSKILRMWLSKDNYRDIDTYPG